MVKYKKFIKSLAKAAREKELIEEKELKELPKHLEKEGVPKHIGNKIHKVIQKPPYKATKRKIGGAIKEAIEHKRRGDIDRESLIRIIQESVSEYENGLSEDELHALIKEILNSELKKTKLLKTYHIERALPTSPEEKPTKLTIPLPSIEEGGIIKRKYRGIGAEWVTEDLTDINITYPILFRAGTVHVYANIRYDPATQGLLYRIIEPQLSKEEEAILKKISVALIDELGVDFATLKTQTAEKYLENKIDSIIDYYNIKMSDRTRTVIDYYIIRDFIGLERVEPLFEDTNIEDISCDGVNIPVYIYHRDPRFGSIKTTTMFRSEKNLDSFVMKLAQRCGRAISVADPLLDGALPDGSRVQATYGTGISMKGSNFTIRKFTKDPLTFVDLLNYGTLNAEMLAYLWLAIEHGKSILIAGPTASGKTTMLNALSLFIRPELKLITIEDTPELRLPHENWIAQVSRAGFGPELVSGKKLGEISLFDLLKASLRQRPDNIIVGEVRGKEAYVLFQQIATGHPGMSTIHAESMQAVINRLRTPPINLPPSLLQHLDILLVLTRPRVKGKYLRRIKEIVEITGFDLDKDIPTTNIAYTWTLAKDIFNYTGKSSILRDVMEIIGATPEGIYLEVERRMKVIEWMAYNGIRDYKNVGRVVREYYQSPEKLLEDISGS